jgi:hypothetical protein
MLHWLRTNQLVSERKARLFAGACCRRIWQYLKDQRSRHLVEVSEAFADGVASLEQLGTAFEEAAVAQEVIEWEGGDAVDQSAAEAVLGLREELQIEQVFEGVAEAVGEARAGEVWERIYQTPGKHYRTQEAEHRAECDAGGAAEQEVQVALLRDICGNPFRPVEFEASWRTPTVLALATAIYNDSTFDEMPILADALEELGADAEILQHLRQKEAGHVRGCWGLDLVLGRS